MRPRAGLMLLCMASVIGGLIWTFLDASQRAMVQSLPSSLGSKVKIPSFMPVNGNATEDEASRERAKAEKAAAAKSKWNLYADGKTPEPAQTKPKGSSSETSESSGPPMRQVRAPVARPRADQIVMLLASDGMGSHGGIPDILPKACQNRQEYAKIHGYKFVYKNTSDYDLHGESPVWAKIPAMKDVFQDYPDAEWIWWLDQDAIVMDYSIKLEDYIIYPEAMMGKILKGQQLFIPGSEDKVYMPESYKDVDEIDILLAQDHKMINAGSFLIRRSAFTEFLLEVWDDPFYQRLDLEMKEQDVLLHFMRYREAFRKRCAIVEAAVLNAYPFNDEKAGWQQGRIAVHFAGCWMSNSCQQQWDDFWARKEELNKGYKDALRTMSDAPAAAKVAPNRNVDPMESKNRVKE